ncbi:NERD domain-containing protein [Halobacteriovorax sp. HFRX-2_2]|uniref:NERD domain-containing protein n=1 Tax=unclassified Halobacteriovorax TaxID=2639665 RepID=UPI0037207314
MFLCAFIFLVLLIHKGLRGENKTALQMRLFLNNEEYHRIHNIIIPSSNGTTQLDHIVISKYGVFIIETKSHKGWIFGDENQKNWTQVLYKRKFSFQNPLRQVYRQKKVLSEFLSLDESKIFPIIYFNGKCTIKTYLPDNVISSGLDTHIRSYRELIFSDEEIRAITEKIDNFKLSSNLRLSDHLRSLERRHNSMVTCPKCGGKLLKKVARKGKYAGGEFLGCMNYPRCRFIKNLC